MNPGVKGQNFYWRNMEILPWIILKYHRDKLFFFSDLHDAFVSYRIANGFAIVLEEPVCAEENKMEVLEEFYKQCSKMGLRDCFLPRR